MAEPTSWMLERHADGIVWLTLDEPGTSTNVLSHQVLEELDELLRPLRTSPPRGLVIRSGKSSGFIAGADIKEFTALTDEGQAYALVRAGQGVLDRLAALPCPTVALLRGFALGGGLELALACRHRVAADDGTLTLGLPEVQLGIHPGLGGTVRAVQLLGVRPAMQLMLTGRPVRADKALAIGLVDRLVPAAQLEAAARDIIRQGRPRRRPPLLERVLSWPGVRPLIRGGLVQQVAARVRREHYPAPYAVIDLWVAHGAAGATAYEAEARSIARLFLTPTSRALVRAFLLQDRLKSLGGAAAAEVRRVHVVGAGVMGGDIAAWCALRGFEVTLQDRSAELVEPAMKRARELFERRLRDPAQAAAAGRRLHADVAGDGVAEADVVIEAIFENADAKRELYARLEPRMQPQALLATNTSSLLLETLNGGLARPGRLVGLHFFNPVAQMPLVEIVRSRAAEPAAVELALAFARRLDKLPLPCASAPGFVVNRILAPYLLEALRAAQEGVPLPVIDQAAVDFGMPIGPVELADVVGLDVASHVGRILAESTGQPASALPLLEERLAAKKLGRKSGEGFYVWRDGKAVKPPAEGAAPPDLADRLMLAMANECVACLRDGVVDDADLIDAAMIFGAGYAPFRGGPLHDARRRGIPSVVARLRELAGRYGPRFTPDPGWERLRGN